MRRTEETPGNRVRKGAQREMSTVDGSRFVGSADGKDLPNPIGGRMVIKVRDKDTVGAFSIHDNTIPPGSPGPLPHIHRDHEEPSTSWRES